MHSYLTSKEKESEVVMFSLEGKGALVTGAGRGIGAAVVEKLLAAGAKVFYNDLDEQSCKDLWNSRPSAAVASNAGYLVGDVTKPEFPAVLVADAIAKLGHVDIVVNNAGYCWDTVIQKTTDEQFQAMLDIHLIAPMRILRAIQPHWKETKAARDAAIPHLVCKVVNISSIAGLDGNAGQCGYSAGKAGIIGMTKTLAKEFGRLNATVNAVAFGLIETRMTQPILDKDNKPTVDVNGKKLPTGVMPELLEAVKKACPLGRLGTVEDAANGVLFMCSPLSDYVTGQVLRVDGGFKL